MRHHSEASPLTHIGATHSLTSPSASTLTHRFLSPRLYPLFTIQMCGHLQPLPTEVLARLHVTPGWGHQCRMLFLIHILTIHNLRLPRKSSFANFGVRAQPLRRRAPRTRLLSNILMIPHEHCRRKKCAICLRNVAWRHLVTILRSLSTKMLIITLRTGAHCKGPQLRWAWVLWGFTLITSLPSDLPTTVENLKKVCTICFCDATELTCAV